MSKKEKILYNIFAKNARYHAGEYLIACATKVIVAKTPKELFQKFKELNEKEVVDKF